MENLVEKVVRFDFDAVSLEIRKLMCFSKQYSKYESMFVDLKSNEDWGEIHSISDDNKKDQVEEIYRRGRDMASFLSLELERVNEIETYPTLTSVIKKLRNDWVFEPNTLKTIAEKARNTKNELGLYCYALDQMLLIFDEQIELVEAVNQTLQMLRNSELYKKENGMQEDNNGNTVVNNIYANYSNVAMNSSNIKQKIEQKSDVFDEILKEIKQSNLENKEEFIADIESMKGAKTKDDFQLKYDSFIEKAANHMAIFGPFLPALSSLFA